MNNPRESIYAALFSLLGTAVIGSSPAFITASRRFRHWDAVSSAEQPALFLRGGNQKGDQSHTTDLTKWTIKAWAFIYCKHSPDTGAIPGTNINNLIDAVDQVLGPAPQYGPQTLGGLVVKCFIDGTVFVDEGMLPKDTQSIAVIPITIITGV